MTPRERAKFVYLEHLPSHRINYDESNVLIDAIEQAITADRQQLQAEIVKRLQLERGESKHAASGDYYFALGINAAIGIVQSIFASPYSSPVESKPEQFSLILSQIARSFCPAFLISNDDPPSVEAIKRRIEWLESQVGELEQECGQLMRESDRRVLAEREACIDFLEAQIKGYEVLIKHSSLSNLSHKQSLESTIHGLRETIKQIRSRSNPSPASEPKECGKDVYGTYDKYSCALNAGHEGRCKYKGQIWAEGQARMREEEAAKKKSQCDWNLGSEQCQLEKDHSGGHAFPSAPFSAPDPLPTIDAPDRIALLTQIIGEQQIKIAQLEKERHEITQKLEASYRHVCASYCDECKSPNNRKA